MVDLYRPDSLRDAIELMYFAYRAFTDRADRILEARGLGRVHHRILYFIGRNPDISVSGLLGVLAVSRQALNAPLRRLVELDLVAAGSGESDRRVKPLHLTESGKRLEAELTGAQMRQMQAAFSTVSTDQEVGWRQVMVELAKTAEESPSPRASAQTSA